MCKQIAEKALNVSGVGRKPLNKINVFGIKLTYLREYSKGLLSIVPINSSPNAFCVHFMTLFVFFIESSKLSFTYKKGNMILRRESIERIFYATSIP
jgi:hypothetical protein